MSPPALAGSGCRGGGGGRCLLGWLSCGPGSLCGHRAAGPQGCSQACAPREKTGGTSLRGTESVKSVLLEVMVNERAKVAGVF